MAAVASRSMQLVSTDLVMPVAATPNHHINGSPRMSPLSKLTSWTYCVAPDIFMLKPESNILGSSNKAVFT